MRNVWKTRPGRSEASHLFRLMKKTALLYSESSNFLFLHHSFPLPVQTFGPRKREREGMRDDKVMLTVQTNKAGHHGVHASKGIHHHHPERCASSHQRVLLLSVPLKQ